LQGCTLIVAATSAGMAETTKAELSPSVKVQIRQLVPDADLSNLTTMQYVRLENLFANSANLRAGESPATRIRIILASED
jgi:hypothetical protein